MGKHFFSSHCSSFNVSSFLSVKLNFIQHKIIIYFISYWEKFKKEIRVQTDVSIIGKKRRDYNTVERKDGNIQGRGFIHVLSKTGISEEIIHQSDLDWGNQSSKWSLLWCSAFSFFQVKPLKCHEKFTHCISFQAVLKKPIPSDSLRESLLLSLGAIINTYCQIAEQCAEEVRL